MKLVNRFKILSWLFLISLSTSAHATLWNINDVLTGGSANGSSGFGASLFHAASASNYMGGSTVGTISGSGVLGTYDDVSGAFNGNFTLSGSGGPTVNLMGNLSFGANGLLDSVSFLTVTFGGTDISGSGGSDIYFKIGYQCCGSTNNDPNTFNPSDNGILTLWGANGWDPDGDDLNQLNGDGDYSSNTSLGLDLQLRLTQVPEPTSLILMSIGLLGLGFRRFVA